MISSSLSIKILGCTFVVGMTIGIPVIAVKEHEKKVAADKEKAVQKRQEEIDNPTTLSKLFANLASMLTDTPQTESVIQAGETFSDEAIQAWTPTTEEKTVIATNFSSITKHMPNEFFIKLQDINLTKAAGVCHIKTYNTTTVRGREKNLYIPFLRSIFTSDLKTDNHQISTVKVKGGAMDTGWGDFLTTNKTNFKKELQEIIQGKKVPIVRVPDETPTTSETTQKEKEIATDLLFLQTLYEGTIDRLTKELGNKDTSNQGTGIIWEISC